MLTIIYVIFVILFFVLIIIIKMTVVVALLLTARTVQALERKRRVFLRRSLAAVNQLANLKAF